MLERFLNAGIRDGASAEERRLLHFHRIAMVSLIWISPMFSVRSYILGATFEVTLGVFCSFTYAYALGLTLNGRHVASKVAYLTGVAIVFVGFWLIAPTNAIYPWFLVMMLYAGTVFRGSERRWKYPLLLFLTALFITGAWFDVYAPASSPLGNGAIMLAHMPPEAFAEFGFSGLATMAIAVVFLVVINSEQMRLTEAHLEREHEKSERLLLNILPKNIAERLKNDPKVIADGFPVATVLFSDIVGFTPMSEKLSPAELVAVLNQLFTGFDRIAARHGLEKIKTIGDAYMVAAGVPVPTPNHAHAVAAMAVEMRAFALDFGSKLEPPVGIRIGVHSGPVVAGVIGESKFAYDLWGDTVNTASRMESSGTPGTIHCSEATRKLLGDAFTFESRGLVELKGKEPMQTYFVTGAAAVNPV